ncbi:MAG TPA: HEAT repeat domain-containing protein [Anaerolineales bacterium]|nr:HEAT repeat domain-containing protein [Anaerolineales bacterium]
MSAALLAADEDSLGQLPLDTLRSALEEADSEVRAVAIYALGTRSEPEAISLLIACLSDPSPFLARTAADSLQRIGPPAAPELIAALNHQSAQVRGLAARSLAHLKDTSAIPALFNALDDDSAIVQYWADEALERMGVGQVYFKP